MTETRPKCLLHIGIEKTGSTSIQAFLNENKFHLFKKDNVLIPDIFERKNHIELVVYSQNGVKNEYLSALYGVRSENDLKTFRARFEKRFMQAIGGKLSPETLALFSNEHCHSRLTEIEEVKRLKALLNSCFSNIRVVVYLRRQDRVAVSRYSTRLKSGDIIENPIDGVFGRNGLNETQKYYDYNDLLNRWSEVFGQENIRVRIYDDRRLKEGDVVTDFMNEAGIPMGRGYRHPQIRSEALSLEAQEFLRIFNRLEPALKGGKPNAARMKVMRSIDHISDGEGFLPSERDARRFLEIYKKSNDEVAKRYFPETDIPLFDDDFSKYPVKSDIPQVTKTQMRDFAVRLQRAIATNNACEYTD